MASLSAHPCMAQRHGKIPRLAVCVMLLYLGMVVAGAQRWAWMRSMRLPCLGALLRFG